MFPLPLAPNLVYVNLTRKTTVIWIAIDLFSFRFCSVLYSLLTVMNEWLFPDQLEIDIGQLNVLNVFCVIANVISVKRNIIGFWNWNSILLPPSERNESIENAFHVKLSQSSGSFLFCWNSLCIAFWRIVYFIEFIWHWKLIKNRKWTDRGGLNCTQHFSAFALKVAHFRAVLKSNSGNWKKKVNVDHL